MAQVLRPLAISIGDPDLLVGMQTGDDAAVYRLNEDTAIIASVDFFTPIVDDPFDWGAIAAANALSDVYAMGGRPLLCLNIAGWPRGVLPLDLLGRVLEGGASVARAAGAIVAGGHTVDDPEPKFGMAVIGLVHPEQVVTNAAARPGDLLYLTKPIGTGVITTAFKNQVADEQVVANAVETMKATNAGACAAMRAAGVRAATDVTGFGLLGHLRGLCAASGVGASITASAVPELPGARALAAAGQIPSGSKRNREFLTDSVRFDDAVDERTRILLCDAQTSGGMLIAIPPGAAPALEQALRAENLPVEQVGSITTGPPGTIAVER